MNKQEIYEFDRLGFIVLKGLLEPEIRAEISADVDRLEDYFLQLKDHPSNLPSFPPPYDKFVGHLDPATASTVSQSSNPGLSIVVDDFLGAAPSFAKLVNHAATMRYVNELVSPPALTSAELRYRYKDNVSTSHMGGPIDARNAYRVVNESMKMFGGHKRRLIDLVCLRVVYALHDIPVENGPLSVVPATHKSLFFSPYNVGSDPHLEPGMIPVLMQAGDALIFTENLRHGGFRNLLNTPRKTIHICYQQNWAGSQSPAHPNGPMRFVTKAWADFSPEQRKLFGPVELID